MRRASDWALVANIWIGNLRGIVFKIAATFIFAVMAMLVKLVASRLPTGEIVFARSFFAMAPIAMWIATRGRLLEALATTRPMAHVVRVFFGISGMSLGFAGLSFISLPDATFIGYAMPIFGVIFAATLLKERVRLYRWSAVSFGMIGVCIILYPHLAGGTGVTSQGDAIGAGLCLAAAVFSALAMVTVRALTATEEPATIAFYFSLGGALLGLLTLPFGWVMPSQNEALLLLAIGVSGGVGQLVQTTSYKHADASLLAPFEYTSMAWAILLGWLVFGDVPGWLTLVGGLVVVLSGLFVIFRERQLGMRANMKLLRACRAELASRLPKAKLALR